MSTEQAIDLMTEFARRTGVTSDEPPVRYLWTDAFAVCNFLGLAERTGESRFVHLARDLIEQTHHVLGYHRQDDERSGWLSGMEPAEGEARPTIGGLRIGKRLPERGPDEPVDRRLEWERDGQYFHYLTKWMHALDQMARFADEPTYSRWARELAKTAHDAFTYEPARGAGPMMYWKMSIDLSRPLVSSMGHHDPLDGFVTYSQLRHTASQLGNASEGPALDAELDTFAAMVEGRDWSTTDPLGLGGLLIDAYRLYQRVERGEESDRELLHDALGDAQRGLDQYASSTSFGSSAQRRLAFRELGLAIGLYGVEQMVEDEGEELGDTLTRLARHLDLRQKLTSFWQAPSHRDTKTWRDHRDINDVMLASAHVSEGLCEVLSLGSWGVGLGS